MDTKETMRPKLITQCVFSILDAIAEFESDEESNTGSYSPIRTWEQMNEAIDFSHMLDPINDSGYDYTLDERREMCAEVVRDVDANLAEVPRSEIVAGDDRKQSCPFCQGPVMAVEVWTATSNGDATNTTELTEFQCRAESCARSFWS